MSPGGSRASTTLHYLMQEEISNHAIHITRALYSTYWSGWCHAILKALTMSKELEPFFHSGCVSCTKSSRCRFAWMQLCCFLKPNWFSEKKIVVLEAHKSSSTQFVQNLTNKKVQDKWVGKILFCRQEFKSPNHHLLVAG